MNERKAFFKNITDTDKFTSLPASAQVLFFMLGMHTRAGITRMPHSIVRMIGATEEDLKMLIDRNFITDNGDGSINMIGCVEDVEEDADV